MQFKSASASFQQPVKPKVRLPELDILRFVAAVAVVLFHYTPVLKPRFEVFSSAWIELPSRYGYLGVDLFFLISGYVIVMSANGRSSRSFLVHRIVRLYPSFWIALAATWVTIIAFGTDADRPSLFNLAANSTMLPGYLGESRIDDVYWTLAIEWKFYALVAIATFVGLQRHLELTAFVWIAVLALPALGVENSVLRSLSIYPYGSYFASGVVLYCIRDRGLSLARATAWLVGWVLSLRTAVIAMPGFIHDARSGDQTVVLGIVTLLFAVFFLLAIGAVQLAPAFRWRVLGAVTFPLYLIHSRIGRLLIDNVQPSSNTGVSLACALLVVGVASFAMAWFIELRFVPWLSRTALVRRLAGETPRSTQVSFP